MSRPCRQQDNIEYLFNSEVREKKRIGTNIFSRVSTRKNGGKQPLRTPYYYMSNKEKKKLNSEVDKYNMNELMLMSELKKKNRSVQKMILENWRKRYTNKEIVKGLGVGTGTYYALLDELRIERDVKAFNWEEVSDERLEEMKKDVVGYDTLMSLPPHQRYQVVPVYLENFTTQELSNMWNVTTSKVYQLKYMMKQHLSKDSDIDDKEVNNSKSNIKEQSESITKKSVSRFPVKRSLKLLGLTFNKNIDKKEDDFYISFNQKGDGQALSDKLEALSKLLTLDNGEFEVSINVKKG